MFSPKIRRRKDGKNLFFVTLPSQLFEIDCQLEIMDKIKIFVFACCLSMLAACHSSDPEEVEWGNRTVLVYMAADNSLSTDGIKNIELMEKGMKEIDGRVIIYYDPANEVPHLMKLERGRLDTLAVYEEENSASPQVLARVVEEVRRSYPADSYGLVLWSHGMGWLPAGVSSPRSLQMQRDSRMPRTKYFGEDLDLGAEGGPVYMDIREIAVALPGGFEFILFDACFMSSIEVLYELKDKADYVIASPAEIISDGFPYDKIMPYLGGGEQNLIQMCQEFYDYYANHPNGGYYLSATIALVKMAELQDMARIVSEILEGKTSFSSEVWKYPLSRGGLPDVFFDFADYIHEMATEEQCTAFDHQLSKLVRYRKATEKFFGTPIPGDKYSGLSVYIPYPQWPQLNNKYKGLAWTKAVYGGQ